VVQDNKKLGSLTGLLRIARCLCYADDPKIAVL
jgi:hypothetical protein